MGKVGNDKALIVSSLALDAYTLSSRPVGVQYGCSINSHVYLRALGSNEAELLGLLRVDVFDKAICRGQFRRMGDMKTTYV